MELKTCSHCHEAKPLSEFYRNAQGHDSLCKVCRKVYIRNWRQAHPERCQAIQKRWREQHPDYMSRYMKRYKETRKAAWAQMTERRCPCCGRTMDAAQFTLYSPYCRECHNAKRREAYRRQQERIRANGPVVSQSTPTPDDVKTCTCCGQTKPLSEFYPDRRLGRTDRYRSHCKACTAAKCRAWRQSHPEKVREIRQRNRSKYLARKRERRAAARALREAQRPKLPEGHRRCSRCGAVKPFDAFYWSKGRYDSWCKECRRAYYRARYHTNREPFYAAMRRWRERHSDKVRAYWREYARRRRQRLKERQAAEQAD